MPSLAGYLIRKEYKKGEITNMNTLSKLIEDYREKYRAEEERKKQVSIQRKAVYDIIESKLKEKYRYGIIILTYQDRLYDEII